LGILLKAVVACGRHGASSEDDCRLAFQEGLKTGTWKAISHLTGVLKRKEAFLPSPSLVVPLE
jgi:hypothetical protein